MDESASSLFEDDERLQHALALAYRYLNRCERTVAEVRTRLQRAAIPRDDAERAIETLIEQGSLDDQRFVQLFVEDKRELDQWGSERIERALLSRGVDGELVREALSGAASQSELDRALEVLRRRFPSPPADRRERERALGVLLRKGYDSELALDALMAYARRAEAA
ncbi:MAG TPA: RecX family transcriptional regulator [Solirubrobacteraceae bacterium]|nr:RecX family transcriptional regulator [Solirubrobacteraceae bacterium]